MIESCGGAGLTLEAFPPIGAVRDLWREHLDRDLAVELGVAGPPHLTHPTGPDGGENFVAAEPVTGLKAHHNLISFGAIGTSDPEVWRGQRGTSSSPIRRMECMKHRVIAHEVGEAPHSKRAGREFAHLDGHVDSAAR